MKNNSQDIPLNFAPKNPNIDSMCFLLGPVAQDRPAKPPRPEAKAACASRNASRKAQHAFSYHGFDLTTSRDEVFTADEKTPPEVKAKLLFIGGPEVFLKGWSKSQGNPRREDDITVAVDPTCYIWNPYDKKWGTGFFLPKRDEEGCSSSNLGGDWHFCCFPTKSF